MAPNSLGRFIRECRESLGFTSRKVEELTKSRPGLAAISHSNLLAIEKGSHVPTYDKILTLSFVFNIPTRHFEDRLKQDMLGGPAPATQLGEQGLMSAGLAALAEGAHSRALDLFTQACAVACEAAVKDPEFIAEARLQAANCRARLGLLRVAKEDLEEILASESTSAKLAVRTSFLLAEVCRELRNLRLALLYARAALEMAIEGDDLLLRAKLENTVANILNDRSDYALAIQHYREAHRYFEKVGDRRAVGLIARNLGKAMGRLGQLDEAARYLQDGLAVARETADRRGEAYGLANLARVHCLKGDSIRSRECARQAKHIAQSENYPDILFVSLYYLWKASVREAQSSLTRVYAERLGSLERKLESRCVELEEWLEYRNATRRIRS